MGVQHLGSGIQSVFCKLGEYLSARSGNADLPEVSRRNVLFDSEFAKTSQFLGGHEFENIGSRRLNEARSS